ncbi:MAG: hypothetical protein RBU21_18200 [FCB group bacterium]|nr:hypothetical protein [FCB group bacterium]
MRYPRAMEFPLAQRELTQAGRDRRTYILRTVLAGGAVVFLLLTWLSRSFLIMATGPSTGNLMGGAEVMGQSLAMTAQGIQLAAAFLVAPIVSAGLICTERQEGTLGLLLMADLSGRDVFLAKFLRAFLFTELLLISMLPFASFAALLGGVSIPEVAARLLALTFYTAAVCAVGLLFSALSRRPATAFFCTLLFTLAWLYGTHLLDAYALPALGLDAYRFGVLALYASYLTFDDLRYMVLPQSLLAVVIAVFAALLTIRILPGLVSPGSAPVRKRRSTTRGLRRRFFFNPAAQIVASGSGGFISGLRPGPVRALVFIVVALLSGIPTCLGGLLVDALMFYDILSSLHAARRDGSLDELVLTPLSERDLARAIFRASLRSALFFGAAGAVFALGSQAVQLFLNTTFWATVTPNSVVSLSDFRAEHLFGIALTVVNAVLKILLPLGSVIMGAAIASYIGVQRGGAARHTATCLAISVFLVGFLTFAYYFIFVSLMTAGQIANLPVLWESYAGELGQLAASVLNLGVYALLTFAFFSMLASSVRGHLIAQPEIYIAVARPMPPVERVER